MPPLPWRKDALTSLVRGVHLLLSLRGLAGVSSALKPQELKKKNGWFPKKKTKMLLTESILNRTKQQLALFCFKTETHVIHESLTELQTITLNF